MASSACSVARHCGFITASSHVPWRSNLSVHAVKSLFLTRRTPRRQAVAASFPTIDVSAKKEKKGEEREKEKEEEKRQSKRSHREAVCAMLTAVDSACRQP